MSYRLAKSLEKFRAQINEMFPKRSKNSDGWIGDAKHASRASDHNPHFKDKKGIGIVSAFDVTHDPKNGVDCQKLADSLVASKDSRIKYLIWNKQIISSKQQPWKWRKYAGSNSHSHHLHISVNADAKFYDDEKPWQLVSETAKPQPGEMKCVYTVKAGDSLSKIAKEYKTTVEKLKTLNGLKSDVIQINQELKLN